MPKQQSTPKRTHTHKVYTIKDLRLLKCNGAKCIIQEYMNTIMNTLPKHLPPEIKWHITQHARMEFGKWWVNYETHGREYADAYYEMGGKFEGWD